MRGKSWACGMLAACVMMTLMPVRALAADVLVDSVPLEQEIEVTTETMLPSNEQPTAEIAASETVQEDSTEEVEQKPGVTAPEETLENGEEPVAEEEETDSLAYTVTFDSNGGEGTTPEAISLEQPGELMLPDAQLTLQKEESVWQFKGWASESDAMQPDYEAGEKFQLQANAVLYAVYAPDFYTVTYQVGQVVTTEQVTPGEFPVNVPTETGEGFICWKTPGGTRILPDEISIWEDRTFVAFYAPSLETESHQKYMDGDSNGLFAPNDSLTRAQAAQILYNLLIDPTAEGKSFQDVASNAWYAPAVSTLSGLGVMNGYADGSFRPDAKITRAECAALMMNFVPDGQEIRTFTDVPESHWAYETIGAAASFGLFSGDPDGSFRPNDTLTRAEAAVVFNRLLGRVPDSNTITSASDMRIFPDVATNFWAYHQIMEATVSHTYELDEMGAEQWTSHVAEGTTLKDGFHNLNGWLYCVQNGQFLRSTEHAGFQFDAQGRYTTGNATLDTLLTNIVRAYTNTSMTTDQKLRALFNYVRDNYTYLKRPLVEKGQTGWEPSYALAFLQNKRGNCYSFAATYYMLVRELGLDANTVVGHVGYERSPHGWVEIRLNGQTYLFDTELEMAYRAKGNYSYDLFKMQYGHTPFIYEK